MSKLYCKVACRGRSCKHEIITASSPTPAIDGIPSAYIRPHLIAMARPSTPTLAAGGLQSLLDAGVAGVVNLQRPGEHAYCAYGLDEDATYPGFSYDPDALSSAGIAHFAAGWEDMAAPSMQILARAVTLVDYIVDRLHGVAAIHCHAGLGRTGTVAAAYLVYAEHISPGAAIAVVREGRRKAIQTKKQVRAVHQYATALEEKAAVYSPHPALLASQVPPHPVDDNDDGGDGSHRDGGEEGGPVAALPWRRRSLKRVLKDQQWFVHGDEARELKHVPRGVCALLDRIHGGDPDEVGRCLETVESRWKEVEGEEGEGVAPKLPVWVHVDAALASCLNSRYWDAPSEFALLTSVSVLLSWLAFSLSHPLLVVSESAPHSRSAFHLVSTVVDVLRPALTQATARPLISALTQNASPRLSLSDLDSLLSSHLSSSSSTLNISPSLPLSHSRYPATPVPDDAPAAEQPS